MKVMHHIDCERALLQPQVRQYVVVILHRDGMKGRATKFIAHFSKSSGCVLKKNSSTKW